MDLQSHSQRCTKVYAVQRCVTWGYTTNTDKEICQHTFTARSTCDLRFKSGGKNQPALSIHLTKGNPYS